MIFLNSFIFIKKFLEILWFVSPFYTRHLNIYWWTFQTRDHWASRHKVWLRYLPRPSLQLRTCTNLDSRRQTGLRYEFSDIRLPDYNCKDRNNSGVSMSMALVLLCGTTENSHAAPRSTWRNGTRWTWRRCKRDAPTVPTNTSSLEACRTWSLSHPKVVTLSR